MNPTLHTSPPPNHSSAAAGWNRRLQLRNPDTKVERLNFYTLLTHNQCFRFFPISFRCALGMPIANWCRTLCLLGFGEIYISGIQSTTHIPCYVQHLRSPTLSFPSNLQDLIRLLMCLPSWFSARWPSHNSQPPIIRNTLTCPHPGAPPTGCFQMRAPSNSDRKCHLITKLWPLIAKEHVSNNEIEGP